MLMTMKNKVIALLLCFHFCNGFAQNKSLVTINWKKDISEPNNNLEIIEKPYFEKAYYPKPNSYPYYIISEIVKGKVEKANISIDNKKTSIVSKLYETLEDNESETIKTDLKYLGEKTLIQFYIPTFEKNNFTQKKILSFEYSFTYNKNPIF